MKTPDSLEKNSNKKIKRKGQIVAVEQVVIFGLGVVLVIFTITAYLNFIVKIQKGVEESVGIALLKYIDSAAHTLDDSQAEFMTIRLNIPQSVTSGSYIIEGGTKRLVFNHPSGSVDIPSDLRYMGESLSTDGKLSVYISSRIPGTVLIK